MKFDPLSVVVRTIFSLILNSVWISFSAPARAEKVCDPLSCLHARAAQDLCMVWGLNQCAVTPMKPRRCAIQQSVFVAMNSISLRATFSFLFTSTEACASWHLYLAEDVAQDQWSPVAEQCVVVSHSLVCLEGGSKEPSVDDFLLTAAEVSCGHLSRWVGCFFCGENECAGTDWDSYYFSQTTSSDYLGLPLY